ncbi:MAG: carboxypeptidase regulatory-like domain-containing protein, partial [Acidobacteria bacterium]|nr:carboxypeptidase regulatory-like domain-containing protein [Acidobacteriota bacterium]
MRSVKGGRRIFCIWLVLAMAIPSAAAAQPPGQAGAGFAGRPLLEVLQQLRDGGLELLFTSQVVRPEMVVREEPRAGAPRHQLDELLRPFGLIAQEGPSRTLVVVPRPGAGPGSGIHGEVRDARLKRTLEGVQVLLPGTPHSTFTDPQGRFTLPAVPPGNYPLEARKPGFVVEQQEAFEVPPWGVVDVSLELLPTPLTLGEVVVTPSRITLLRSDPVPSLSLQKDEIVALPHLGDDLFRALTLFPGTAGNELTAQLNIRGGRADEVLIRLDQLELIEPYHLQDFLNAFSIIAPKAIAEVD